VKASRARGQFLVAVFLSWNLHAQGVAPTNAPAPPGPDVLPSDSAPAPPPSDVPLAEIQERYDQEAIGFDDFGSAVTEHGVVTGTVQWSTPYQGKYKKPLAGVDFYRALGRTDLVQQYEEREALRTGLMVGGGLVFLAGLITATALASSQATQCTPITPGSFSLPSCQSPAPVDPAFGWLAVGGVVAGGGVFLAGAGIDPDPVGTVGKRQLAETYNRDLWDRLSSEPRAEAVDVHVAPYVGKDGAGIGMAVRF